MARFRKKALSPPTGRWSTIFDYYPGTWQQDTAYSTDSVVAYWALFACATAIAGDIAKCKPVVMKRSGKIWVKTPMRRLLLKKPNGYQTTIEFIFCWVMSKLLTGNTYVLKQRGPDGNITAMYVLDPLKVTPLISGNGGVFYRLGVDNLAQITEEDPAAPASEIIHDKMYPIFHPLVGVSPIYACNSNATAGLAMQDNSKNLFSNMSRPGGMLTAPAKISDETASRLKTSFETNYGGDNFGKLLVAGDGLEYKQMSITAVDAQLIEQAKMTAEAVCATFHFPGHKIGVGEKPTVNNAAVLNQQYYDQCLQFIFEMTEAVLDQGLELLDNFETRFDIKNLLRMDPEARIKTSVDGITGGLFTPNEGRADANLAPVEGGDTPYLQQQNYSLAALAKRDAQDNPFGTAPSIPVGMAMDALMFKEPLTVREAQWTS